MNEHEVGMKNIPEEQPKRRWYKRPRNIIMTVVAVLVLLILGRGCASGPEVTESEDPATTVEVLSVSDYQSQRAVVQAFGMVESEAQAEIKSEVGVPVQGVYAEVGDQVTAGQPLVEFVHEDYDAQLAASSASVARAQSALDLLLVGPREEERLQARLAVAQAEAQLITAQAALETARTSVQTSFDAAYNGGIVTARDLYTDLIEANLVIADYQVLYFDCTDNRICYDITREKRAALKILVGAFDAGRWNPQTIQAHVDEGLGAEIHALEEGDVDIAALDTVFSELIEAGEATRAALISTRAAFDASIATGYTATDIATVEAERAVVDASISTAVTAQNTLATATVGVEAGELDNHASLVTARATVDLRQAALSSAQAAYDAIVAGPREIDLAGARASLREAQAAYQNIASQQRKYVLTAPFNGTVATMQARVGEPVQVGTTAVSVVNANLIDVVAYVDEAQRSEIAVGDFATFNGTVEAVVTAIAPSIDPSTQKVEVRLSALGPAPSLTVGSSVTVEIQAAVATAELLLPRSAVQLTSSGAFVYVIEDGVSVARPVTVGGTVGNAIEVTSGITASERVIEQARGLQAGRRVIER